MSKKNIKNIFKTILVTVSLFSFSLLVPVSTLAWEDCPKGEINDPYPGDCARYIDIDGNGICDHSEPAPEDRVENTDVPVGEDVELTTDKEVENADNTDAKTDSTEKDNSFPKPLLAIAIVIINLAGILLYAKYRNSKSS